jgi:hypothetical protein
MSGDPYWSNVVLLMGFEGANGSTGAPGMNDESPHAHGTATNTNTIITTTSEKFGSSSLYMNYNGVTGSVITFPTGSDWQLGSGPFTIEMWVSCDTSIGGFGPCLVGLWGASGNFSWLLSVQGQKLCWNTSTTGSNNLGDIIGFSSLPYGTPGGAWIHVGIDFDGSKYRLYNNGFTDGSFSTPRTLFNSTAPLSIGANYNATSLQFDGFIDELRITKGIARYASDSGYTVPTAAFPRTQYVIGDPHWSNVVLLMGFEGANGSQGAPGMTDESPHAHGTGSVIGSAVIDTSQFKFGSSSGHNTGVGLSSIGFADSPDWKLSSANSDQYTVECWVRFTTLVANMVVIAEFTGGSDFAFTLQLHTTTSEIVFSTSPDGTFGSSSAAVTAGAGLTTGVWYFVAVDKDATGKIRIYVNGVMLGSITPANSSMFDSTAGLSVTSSGAGNSLNGWVDEVRITKGVARYASDAGFAVPTAAFPRGPFVAPAPVVSPGSFSLTLPVHAGQVIGVMTATNSPTSWSITGGDPSGFYTIDNLGNISITPAGATGIIAGPASLTVQACNVAATDPSFSNVVLLMGFEGPNGSTGAPGFNDESPAANGTAGWISTPVIDTSQFKFGTSSLHGVGGGLIYSAGPNWNLSSANSDQFTIELWVRFNTISTSNILVAQYTVSGTYSWTVQTASATDINFGFSPDGTFASQVVVGTTGASLTTGTWYFIAVDKDATGKIRVYVNGVMRGSATPASSAFFHSSVSLGIEITAGGGGPLDGWMDELRITKGVARYASDAGFTPPTAAFPRS